MIPFKFGSNSDYVEVEFHLKDPNCIYPILSLVLQICNLSRDFLDNLKILTGADFYFITVIDYDAYRSGW